MTSATTWAGRRALITGGLGFIGSTLAIRVTGTMTVETGASIDVSALNGTLAPSPYTPNRAGGGHGGSGDTSTGTAGAPYDSVYRPQLAGSPGHNSSAQPLDKGGGVLDIEAGSLVLQGQLLAIGATFTADGYSTGAGGTV